MKLTHEEIRVLIIEKIAGDIDPADDLIIERLIADDPFVRDMWLSVSKEVQQAEALGFSINIDEQEQWKQLEPKLRDRSFSRTTHPIVRVLTAACVAGILIIGGWWVIGGKKSPQQGTDITHNPVQSRVPTLQLPDRTVIELTTTAKKRFKVGNAEFETDGKTLSYTTTNEDKDAWTLSIPAGSEYKIRLSDGTMVWLNATSVIRFPGNFSGNTREISIEGEGFFEVSKNIARPFIVHTPSTDVMVTGTSFNVNTYNNSRTRTALVEGSVILRNNKTEGFQLKPGFEAHLNDKFVFESRPFDSLEVLSWMKGVYYFRNTPLNELSAVMKRWYAVESEFANKELQNKTFSGELQKNQPLSTFLDNLNLSGDVHCTLADGKVHFK